MRSVSRTSGLIGDEFNVEGEGEEESRVTLATQFSGHGLVLRPSH